VGAAKVELTQKAVKDLDRLRRGQPLLFVKLASKIRSLGDDPEAGKPLVGPLKGVWSLRVGDQRILYKIERGTIIVLTVNHRREAYK
jgi:mRNA interferase RelE/StbE